MPLLAVDTSTRICSVAVRNDGGRVTERTTTGLGMHSEKVFLFISELLNAAKLTVPDLDAVILTGGPGSYTGLRIGASGVKGILFMRSAELYTVNTLAYFASCCKSVEQDAERIHGIADARRVHLYHQLFDTRGKTLKPAGKVDITPIEELDKIIEAGDALAGTGTGRLPEQLAGKLKIFGESVITASGLFHFWDERNDYDDTVVKKVAPENFEPYYYSSAVTNRK